MTWKEEDVSRLDCEMEKFEGERGELCNSSGWEFWGIEVFGELVDWFDWVEDIDISFDVMIYVGMCWIV